MKQKRLLALTLATMLAFSIPVSASATWQQDSSGTWSWTENGERATGWKTINEKQYFFDDNGNMQTGWIEGLHASGIPTLPGIGIWQYADDSGSLVTDKWIQSGEKWYYIAYNGYMLTNAITPDGYLVDKDGVWQTDKSRINLNLPADTNLQQINYFIDTLADVGYFADELIDNLDKKIRELAYEKNINDYFRDLDVILNSGSNLNQKLRISYNYICDKYGLNIYCTDLSNRYNKSYEILDYVHDMYQYQYDESIKILAQYDIILQRISALQISLSRVTNSLLDFYK